MEYNYKKSEDERVLVLQQAIETYIVNDTALGGNYRRDALLLMFNLSNSSWNDIFIDINDYFLSIIYAAIQKLNEKTPKDEYNDMLKEIEKYLMKDD